ncbi:tetratricopeptide repeat domain protein [Aspergillus heteromorphus CBS 117.55]|uniref:Tetratricopeptide repeat domain protein n=1 Tax=Aspergillus heteromorphus CBS 117.55 TaxID=1448321 RepID=A0A317VGM9_9EURO|nr:tetratricopeptide repeat domain protein [Aspergillus heteromorphus CBS 117.55]PWY72311.1 tetratricopeptide repeat domain protein [Aspergillus heteromorphus CBS 117.55]
MDAKRQFEREIILRNSIQGAPNRFEAKNRILRASDVLLSLVGKSTTESDDTHAGVASPQEALRLFPPFRDDDGLIFGAVNVNCPDCDAVFSSLDELKQHYLTKYCPGTAVAVYVMTRDRLITKGYRVEKRFISLNSRPIYFFCDNCERQFTFGEDDNEGLDRQRDESHYIDCKHCGEQCNVAYQPILNDPRDGTIFRDSISHSRSSSIAPTGSVGCKIPSAPGVLGDQSFSRKAKKLRDSWSFRKFSQSEEDELVAISFAGLYDLERAVHAPNGIYRQIDANNEPRKAQSAISYVSNELGMNGASTIESKRTVCEEGEHPRNGATDSENENSDGQGSQQTQSRTSRRQSFLQRLFGRKVPKGVSRARSTADRSKRLMKRANTIRFSFVTKYTRSESRATARKSESDAYTKAATEPKQESVADTEYIALLRGTQNIFIHTQHISGGTIVHDAAGRQRILKIDDVAQLFLQMKDEAASASIWSRTIGAQIRAETALKQGNLKATVVEYHNALRMLDDTPGLDMDKQSRAAILHSLGQAYRDLDMTQESAVCYLKALGLFKRTLGRDHPNNFAILHDLGDLCAKDGYATEASALYERSYAGRNKTLGHNAPETLRSMQDLASLKVSLGDLESALFLLEKAVPALDTVFGLQNATTLSAKNQLSLLYHKLGFNKEARTICERTIPHYKTFFGITSPIIREAVVRYLECSENLDFPSEIKDTLDQYQQSREPDALRVIHRLGRSYMKAGLNRDAANIFEALVEDFLAVKGPEATETFDALSALCVSREQLDSLDQAILAYKQLVHMARRTPGDRYMQKRIVFAEKKICELNGRRDMLAAERKEWALQEPGPCESCEASTTTLCNTCKIFRFCSDTCHKSATTTHQPACIPSVSVLESHSLKMKHKCPVSARDQAISKIRQIDAYRPVSITASHTFHLDSRKFTTFRMKLNPDVNTAIVFSRESDIRYTILDNSSAAQSSTTPSFKTAVSSLQRPRVGGGGAVQWLSPEQQESICHIPPETLIADQASQYLLVAPGTKMLRALIDKRVRVRGGGGEKETFRALELPNEDLVEYAQGLDLSDYPYEPFMYIFEWVWK